MVSVGTGGVGRCDCRASSQLESGMCRRGMGKEGSVLEEMAAVKGDWAHDYMRI